MGIRFAAHQGPERAILPQWRQQTLRHTRLQRDPLQGGNCIAIHRQFRDPLDQPARQTHRAGSGVVDVDPLEPGSQSLLDRLHQHGRPLPQQGGGGRRGREQPVAKRNHLVTGGDQAQQRAGVGYHMKAGTGPFGLMLQFDDFRSHLASQTDHPLCLQGKRQVQLLARDRQTANPHECARIAVRDGWFHHR